MAAPIGDQDAPEEVEGADRLFDEADPTWDGLVREELADMLAGMIEEDVDGGGVDDDAHALGALEPTGPAEGLSRGEGEDLGPIPEVVEVVEAVADALGSVDPPNSGGASSSGLGVVSAPPLVPQIAADGLTFPESGYVVSDMGYVRCNREGHDPQRTVGLVGWKTDGKSIFANCHLHSACSISCGIMRKDVSREYMAEWLVKGIVPPAGSTVAEKKALGVAHRKLWVKP